MSLRVVNLLAALGLSVCVVAQHFALDPAFGTNGMAYYDAPNSAKCAMARTLIASPDGRLTGVFTAGQDSTIVRRFLSNGSLDPTFGEAGTALVTTTIPGFIYSLCGMVMAADGDLYIAGSRQITGGAATTLQLVRLNPDGSFDTAFDNDGLAQYSATDNSTYRSIALQPDGKVLIAGNGGNGFVIIRLHPDGQVDQTFAENGIGYYTKGAQLVRVNNIRVGASGGIHVVGYLSNGMDATGLMVCKVNSDGLLDTGYATGGFFIHDHTENIFRMESLKDCVPGPDGSLLAAGHIALDDVKDRFCALKLRPDGSLDPAFGVGGITLAGTATDERNVLENVVLDPRGFYVLYGILAPPVAIYRSLFLCIDLAGNPIPDTNGDIFQVHLSQELSQYNRRMVADNSGGFIFAVGYYNRPMGDHSLARMVLATPITLATPEHSLSRLRAWPNPATERINVQFDGAFDNSATIVIIDAMGRRVPIGINGSVRWMTDRTLELDLPRHIANGSYSLRITAAGEQAVANFVVQR